MVYPDRLLTALTRINRRLHEPVGGGHSDGDIPTDCEWKLAIDLRTRHVKQGNGPAVDRHRCLRQLRGQFWRADGSFVGRQPTTGNPHESAGGGSRLERYGHDSRIITECGLWRQRKAINLDAIETDDVHGHPR